jgi:uncharacterized protein YgiM (DUF1202 family)
MPSPRGFRPGQVTPLQAGQINIRSGPGTDFAAVGTVNSSYACLVLGQNSGWAYAFCRVTDRSTFQPWVLGWLAGEVVQTVDSWAEVPVVDPADVAGSLMRASVVAQN